MEPVVKITFDCLPMRSIARLDLPIDAPPEFLALYRRIKEAADRHGLHNAYYLYNAQCVFHLTNEPAIGKLEFRFEGTVLTDSEDCRTLGADLEVSLVRETCDWLIEPVVRWFEETVRRAVIAEFDRYIAAGDLDRAKARLERLEAESDAHGGFLGMGL